MNKEIKIRTKLLLVMLSLLLLAILIPIFIDILHPYTGGLWYVWKDWHENFVFTTINIELFIIAPIFLPYIIFEACILVNIKMNFNRKYITVRGITLNRRHKWLEFYKSNGFKMIDEDFGWGKTNSIRMMRGN